MKLILTLFSTLFLSACMGMPEKVQPVDNFELQRFLGTWYEIARLDHSFERGLSQVTAQYALKDTGMVEVKNQGFDTDKKKWKDAIGKAKLAGDTDEGYLKVSFFGPFYSSYVIFELGSNYDYAFVSGFNTDYLWLLARKPEISEELKQRFIAEAQKRGFDTQQLIFVEHNTTD